MFEYEKGEVVRKTRPTNEKSERYMRRCFVMSRTIVQFDKFARFEPRGAALDDGELAARVRAVTHMRPWNDALPWEKRIVFPGYADLRSMSKARGRLMQKHIGLGWPTYFRLGNARMFYRHDVAYQEKTHNDLNRALARNEFFILYLSDYPTLHINHAVTVLARKQFRSKEGEDRYSVYDPNHPDAPRELKWLPKKGAFDYEKDEEFVGGFTRAFQVYGKPFQ
ncbi:MAG: hypothetical protein ABI925_02950 [Verrucomicrobiota bacterium]